MMKKSQIEWCDFTWNPVTGCRKNCPFCEGLKWLTRFQGNIRLYMSNELIVKDEEQGLFILTKPFPTVQNHALPAPTGGLPTLHPYRLPMVARKWKPANIYIGYLGDLFGEWIPTDWIVQVFNACKAAPWHNYLFLTMNPARYFELLKAGKLVQADNFWYGTRLAEGGPVFTAEGYHSFVCMDPMGLYSERMDIPEVEWILLGGYGKLKRQWVESVMERRRNIPIFMIGSKLFKETWNAPLIQEYPPLLSHPREKKLPQCKNCMYCYSVRQGRRGVWRACLHGKIIRQDKNPNGRHIAGRYTRVSPQWCPKRSGTNWRTKR